MDRLNFRMSSSGVAPTLQSLLPGAAAESVEEKLCHSSDSTCCRAGKMPGCLPCLDHFSGTIPVRLQQLWHSITVRRDLIPNVGYYHKSTYLPTQLVFLIKKSSFKVRAKIQVSLVIICHMTYNDTHDIKGYWESLE